MNINYEKYIGKIVRKTSYADYILHSVYRSNISNILFFLTVKTNQGHNAPQTENWTKLYGPDKEEGRNYHWLRKHDLQIELDKYIWI